MKMQQRRRLTDLYSRGEYIELSDNSYVTHPDGTKTSTPPIVLWIRKMTPVDAETAYLKASARRATLIAGSKTDPPSDLYVSLKGEIDQFTKEDLVAWAVGTDLVSRRPVIEAKVASDEEWTDNRYLESLRERITDDDFGEKDAEDPEVVRIVAELARFQEAAEKAIEVERGRLTELYEQDTDVELRDRILKDMLQGQGDALWLHEFQSCQVWLCTYDGEDKKKRYFTNRSEVDELQAETAAAILEAVERLHVGDIEGKDSQQTADSSQQSESQEVPATDNSSSLPV